MKDFLKKVLRILPDNIYIQLQYFYHFHKFANLKNPQTFNEKLQWIKLYDRNPLYTIMVDKYKVKEYVANIIGEQYIIPTLGVWEKAEEINFDKLPNQFVLKCNHNSGGNIICKDKLKLDKKNVVTILSKSLKDNGYWYGREWPYRNVKPYIIAEKYMEDKETKELRDYKLLCFNGKVQYVEIHSGRFTKQYKQFFYDVYGHIQPFNNKGYSYEKHMNIDMDIVKDMIPLAEKLSKNIPQVRIDFYNVNGNIFFGEITFFDGSGYLPFVPNEWDRKLGDLIELSKIEERVCD